MAKPKKYDCTGHIISLCPENKDSVCEKIKEMRKRKSSVSFSSAINEIVLEWSCLKSK